MSQFLEEDFEQFARCVAFATRSTARTVDAGQF